MNKIVRVFPHTDLRNGHLGLSRLALKQIKKNPQLLDNGSFLLFLNRAQSAFKMFAANNVVVHYKSPRGRVNIDAIKYLPACFNGGKLDYDKALEKVLTQRLG